MVKRFIREQLNQRGYDIVKLDKEKKLPPDFEEHHTRIYRKVQEYTMTTPERIFGLIEAVNYLSKHRIEGDFVECGVWKGGSMLAMAEALCAHGDTKRQLFLYDTFEGMPPPGSEDVSYANLKADDLLNAEHDKEKNLIWAYSSLETVRQAMNLSAYPAERITYVKGKVEDTIPKVLPERIALLRLDTDWYESTRHELEHLYPRLVPGGVLIIDDYGYWKGARKAVDEYLAKNQLRLLLNRLDDTGRIAIKLDA